MGKIQKAKAILVTGAGGEIGTNLLKALVASNKQVEVLGLDLREPQGAHRVTGVHYLEGDVVDSRVFHELEAQYDIEKIFHLAAILSTGGEKNPERTYQVNVEGSMNVLSLAQRSGAARGTATMVIFPSTIAVYGVAKVGTPEASEFGITTNDQEEFKRALGPIRESQHLMPITMYGVDKLAVEHFGRYYSNHYQLLSSGDDCVRVDFRCIRLAGVLSADTLPSGGTSDYGPEMIHAAAQGKLYECFCRPETTIPFLSMPDAVTALLQLSQAPRENIKQKIYNVAGFSVSAREIADAVRERFPESTVVFRPHPKRTEVLESWPAVLDDSAARREWGWNPKHDFAKAMFEYMIPGVLRRYEGASTQVLQKAV